MANILGLVRPLPYSLHISIVTFLFLTLFIIKNTQQQQQQLPLPQQQSRLVGPNKGPPIISPCPHAIRMNTDYRFRGSLHFICLQSLKTGQWLQVISYNERRILLSKKINELGADQLASFVDDDGNLRILLSVPSKINGTMMLTVENSGSSSEEEHTINSQYVSAMSIWRLELNLNWHLAVANQPSYDNLLIDKNLNSIRAPLPEPKPMISIHSWRSSYFDSYQLIHLPFDGKINKLEPMNVNGIEFLIVAIEPYQYALGGRGRHAPQQTTDSIIYKLDFGDGNLSWQQYQLLGTHLTLDIKSFTITHQNSPQRDYYIAAIGSMKPEQNYPKDEGYGLIVFKFLGDYFFRSHFLPISGATKLDAINYGSGDSHVIIAILSGWSNRIDLVHFDGLTLRMLPNPFEQVARSVPHPFRGRRTHDGNLHLFMMPPPPPPSEVNDNNNTNNVKRDNIETMDTLSLPALTFSKPEEFDEYDYTRKVSDRLNDSTNSKNNNNSQNKLVYSIPVDDIINEPSSKSSSGNYEKRDKVQSNLEVLDWCRSTIDSILGDDFHDVSKRILSLPRVNQPQPIVIRGDLIINDNLHVSNMLYVNKVEEVYNKQQVFIEELPLNLTQIFDQINQANLEVDSVKQTVDQILVDDGSTQDVFNPLIFEKVVIECPNLTNMDPRFQSMPFSSEVNCPHIDDIRTIYLNERNISDIRSQALLTGRSMTIARDVRFEHLVLRGSVDLFGTINGLHLSDIVFKRGPPMGPIFGHKHFRAGLFSTSRLSVNNWNGAEVNRNNFLTSNGQQIVRANLKFNHIIIDSGFDPSLSSRIERINSLHFDSHLRQIAQLDSDNRFDIPIRFERLILEGPVQLPDTSLLSSIDAEEIWINTMFKHSNQNVSALIDFMDVHVAFGGDMVVNGTINGVTLDPRLVMMRDRDYEFRNPVVFEGDVFGREIFLEKALNGIQVVMNGQTSQPELAILYDGLDQILGGDKILSDIRLGGHSFIDGNINGALNLSQLYHLATSQDQPLRFSTIRLVGETTKLAEGANIHIASTVDGIPVSQLCRIANKAASSPVTQYNRIKFEQPVTFKNLRCAALNGYNNLTHSFMTRFGDQHIAGTLRLTNGLVLNTTFDIRSSLNELNIGPLPSAIANVVQESQTGHKIIKGDLVLDSLVTNRINDLDMNDILETRSDRPQIVRAPMTFNHLDIENVVKISGDLLTNSFNQLNVSDLLFNTLQYDTPQIVYNHLELDTLHLLPDANLTTNSFNGHDLRRLYADSVLRDVPQQILARKTFARPIEFADRVFSRHGIDELSENELKFNMLLQSDELIDGDLELSHDIFVKKGLEIQSGLINDIDLNTFVSSIIHENLPSSKGLRVTTNGSIQFKDVYVNNLVVGGTVQGVDISRDFLQRDNSTAGPRYGPSRYAPIRPNYQLSAPIKTINPLPQQPAPLVRLQPQIVQHLSPNRQSMNILNASAVQNYWRPSWDQGSINYKAQLTPMFDPALFEHQNRIRSEALRNLASRINRYLSVTFFYDIIQKHHLLGPVLHAARNPIRTEEGSALLFLKGTEKRGEPCLQIGQTIAVMAQERVKNSMAAFTKDTLIPNTSNPLLSDSIVVGNDHYLFVLDSQPIGGGRQLSMQSFVNIHIWDEQSGMYFRKQSIPIDGVPTSMRACVANNVACLAIANPQVTNGNWSGPPVMLCQTSFRSDFNNRILIPIEDVFKLDIISNHRNYGLIMAFLSQKDSEQLGDLSVAGFNLVSRDFKLISTQRMIRPLALHFVRQLTERPINQLVVSEGIASNNDVLSMTRIFTLRFLAAYGDANVTKFYESQIFKDNQFYDVQSVSMDENHSMIFLQSVNSISIYSPSMNYDYRQYFDCDPYYSLVQRLPTKGANKFLVFNEKLSRDSLRPLNHFLVLSRDQCDQQQYSTLILKSRFK